ncbi:hypothetical protein [Streptomyces sp. MNU89]|uniref:hypothetical protein n=1 Tax=Streptomyces sp. MNU89 TaxID=2560025 RepID=UPI001E4AD302|nr:hypothetical protein [Streptomyces sp. MNU89]MCC9737996.1 hypothetical protein [Streptomyces sp. MNU89]
MRGVPGRQFFPGRRSARSAAALLLAAAALAGCGGDDTAGGESGLSVGEVQEAFERGDPESVTGERGTFSARVENVISPWAFTIGGGDFGDADPLLVIEEGMPPVDQDDPVQVEGIVHRFDFSRVQKDLGVDLAEPLYQDFSGEPYVKADKIAEDVGE